MQFTNGCTACVHIGMIDVGMPDVHIQFRCAYSVFFLTLQTINKKQSSLKICCERLNNVSLPHANTRCRCATTRQISFVLQHGSDIKNERKGDFFPTGEKKELCSQGKVIPSGEMSPTCNPYEE